MTLDTSTGHAVVEGTGEMEGDGGSMANNYNAWGIYKSSFKSVEIKEGITSVGAGAFEGTAIESVSIPDTVTKIESAAFHSTTLSKLVIPDSVTYIGRWAFDYSDKLQELTFPDSLTVDRAAFNYISPRFICSGGGDTAKCDAVLAKTNGNLHSESRPSYKIENGNIVERYQYDEEGNLVSYTKSNADGSVYTYDADGNVKSIRGKKIYTVEEAEAVTAHGDRFHVSLTYK